MIFVVEALAFFFTIFKSMKAIGYNFIVGKDGKIYEGRGFRKPQTAGEGKLSTVS